MAGDVLTIEAAREANVNVVDEPDKGAQAVHDVVVAYQANRRSGTASTKTRGEVAGSNKKLWRQKGTGRARMGERRSPIWSGGGIVFGPRPRSYAKAVNKKTRRLAFRKALTERIAAGDVVICDAFATPDGKTKTFVADLHALAGVGNTLVIAGSFDEKTYLAARNYKPALLVTAGDVNVEQLLLFEKIVVVGDALGSLAERTAN